MNWQGSLLPLFWTLILIFLTQLFIHRLSWLRIPSVIAYIVLGIFIGNGGFFFFPMHHLDWINGIGQFGLFYLMFLSGMEIDFKLLRSAPKNRFLETKQKSTHVLSTSTLVFACSLVLSFLSAMLMYQLDHRIQPWMMMLILSTTSLSIVLPVLKEEGLLQHLYGQLLLCIAFIADFIVMIIISVVGDMYTLGFSWKQLIIGLLLPLFFVSYFTVKYARTSKFWKNFFQSASSTKIQAVLALLALYGILSDFTGAEPMLGSFLAGILLSCFDLDETHPLRKQLDVIGYSFFIPIFFVMIGIHIPLHIVLSLRGEFNWVLFLLACAYSVKLLPMLWFGQGFGGRASFAGGVLLSSNLTLVLVATSIAVKHGILPNYISNVMLIVALTTCVASPVLFSRIYDKKLYT